MANKGKRMVNEDLIKQIGQGGGAEYTAGDGIDITEDVISVDTETVALKSDLATVATTGDYDDLTDKPDLSHMVEDNDTTFPFVGNIQNNGGMFLYKKNSDGFYQDHVTVESTDDPVLVNLDALSGDYTKLTNTPTIPDAVSGTNDGTNWTSITIGSTTKNIPQGGGSSERKIEYKDGPVDASGLTAWLKGMPIIIAESTTNNLTAFVNDLTNKGYTNIITDIAIGESVKVNGFFATPYTSGSTMLGLHYFCTDLGSSASQSVYGRSCNIEYELQRSDNRQLMM